MDRSFKDNSHVVVATEAHAPAITSIYRSVQIDPRIFLDLVSPSPKRSTAACRFVASHGGFICPPDETDMRMSLQNGLTLVYIREGEVVGYNRYATDADTVHRVLCTELRLDPSKDYSNRDSLVDWSGSDNGKEHKTLTRVHWTDKEQALDVLRAAKAGVQKLETGKLAWSIDSAVHPGHRRSGIGKTLTNCMREELKPGFSCVAYRMFQILRVNDIDVDLENVLSKKTFSTPTSKLFACTEEDLRLRDGLSISVRWNHWAKRF